MRATGGLFDFYASARDTEPKDTGGIAELVKLIRGERHADAVAEIRRAKAAGASKDELAALKRELPAVTLSGTVEGRKKNAFREGRFSHSGLLQIDLDGKDHPGWTVEKMREALVGDPHMLAVFRSPSGDGMKGVAAIKADPETHLGCFRAAEAHFAALGLTIDKQTKDLTRFCYLSHDPDAWLRDGEAVEFEPLLEDAEAARPEGAGLKLRERPRPAAGADELGVEDVREMLSHIPPRPDYETWLRIASAVWDVLPMAAGCRVLNEWSPEEKDGEYAEKWRHRLEQITVGTLVWYAQQHGYRVPVRVRMASLNITREHAEQIEEAVTSGRFLLALADEDRGLAQAYADIRANVRRYAHDEKAWRIYERGTWVKDETGRILDDLQFTLTPLLVESVNHKASTLDPGDKEGHKSLEPLRKAARRLNRVGAARAVLENAAVLPELRCLRGDFDRRPELLAVENGVVEFGGEGAAFLPHDPAHLLTYRAPITWEPSARCPAFDSFLEDVMCGNLELVDFIWESLAIAATGRTSFDYVWFHYGGGSNGKSTFYSTVLEVLGAGVCRTFDSGLLVGRDQAYGDDYKKADLEGVRLAIGDELPGNQKLRERQVKAMCGGDVIQARNPYEKPRNFTPTHKTWLLGNHKPTVSGTDLGIWRRLLLVPWNATFPPGGMSREERVALHASEASGILNRIMAAWGRVAERGLHIPAAVRDASGEYRAESDQVRQFVEDRLHRLPGYKTRLADILKAYTDWCAEEGERQVVFSSRKLGVELRRLDFEIREGAGGKAFVQNCELVESEECLKMGLRS